MTNQKKVYSDIMVFDAHCDTANALYNQTVHRINQDRNHLDINKAKIGGLNAQIFALYVHPAYAPYRSIKKALLLYRTLENKLFSLGDAVKVTSTFDMKSALKKRKLACWLSLEGGHIIENSIEMLELFYTLGVRCMTLTHSKNTDWADSSADKPQHDGLNKLGKKIIQKMNELSMIIDVSHSSDKTVEDVIDVSSMPVMASHSNAKALCDIPRNLSDDLIREIASRNGYIGVNFFPAFLKKNIYEQLMQNIKKNSDWFNKSIQGNENNPDFINQIEMVLSLRIVKGAEAVDLNAVIDHIIHIIDLGGINCVGLGSDFDGIPVTPTDLTDVSCYPALIDGLALRGFKREEINKIMGLNLFHFLKFFDH